MAAGGDFQRDEWPAFGDAGAGVVQSGRQSGDGCHAVAVDGVGAPGAALVAQADSRSARHILS